MSIFGVQTFVIVYLCHRTIVGISFVRKIARHINCALLWAAQDDPLAALAVFPNVWSFLVQILQNTINVIYHPDRPCNDNVTMVFGLCNWYVPRKAVGEMIPVRLATRIVVPDSRNGEVKSTAASLSALTLRDVSTMSNFLATNSPMRPFHLPFCNYRPKNWFIFWGLGQSHNSIS